MVWILSFPAFSTLDAVIPLSFILVAPVFFWVVVIVFFCHSISYCYVLICFILPSIIYYLSYRKLLSFSLYNLAIINDIRFHCRHVILCLFQAFFGHGISIRIRRHRFASTQPWPDWTSVGSYCESDFKLDFHFSLICCLYSFARSNINPTICACSSILSSSSVVISRFAFRLLISSCSSSMVFMRCWEPA